MLISIKPIVFDLDDFSEEIMTDDLWHFLLELKRIYPKFKVTMFTVPLLCSEGWLKWVKKEYDWIEMHYHGSNHIDRDEWFDKTEIEFPYGDFFYRGFKAPWWRMNQKTADVLNEKGFLISASKNYFDVNGDRVYRFNLGQERIGGIWYENSKFHSFHSHVQEQRTKVGLPDVFNKAINSFYNKSEFLFISELNL